MSPLVADVPLPEIPLESTPYGAILADVLTRLKAVTLHGISTDRRVIRRAPWDVNLACPYATVSLFPETIDPDAGSSGTDDIGYGVMLAMVAANNGVVGAKNLGTLLSWRWEVMRAFHNQREFITGMPQGTCPLRCVVQPGEPLIPALLRSNYDAQYWLLRIDSREVR